MSQGKLLPNCFKIDKVHETFYLRKLKIPRDSGFNYLFDRGLITFEINWLPEQLNMREMNSM